MPKHLGFIALPAAVTLALLLWATPCPVLAQAEDPAAGYNEDTAASREDITFGTRKGSERIRLGRDEQGDEVMGYTPRKTPEPKNPDIEVLEVRPYVWPPYVPHPESGGPGGAGAGAPGGAGGQ
jgi:hypothetical protein